MATTASVYIATSLDGFIARENGAIDWLMDANASIPPGEDCGYADFMSTIDVLIMGRNTYEQVAQFDPWPYDGRRVVVLSSRALVFRRGAGIQLEASTESPRSLLTRLSAQGYKRAYVDGGQVIQSFLRERLIHDMTITTIPILLGSGRRLFDTLPREMKLRLASSKSFEFGFTQATYLACADA
ncbi:MAG: dihydrofolate reductase [Chloroflexi bacterium]|nr:dihydrofolate reductase [Chloroflexota bacterium]